MAVSSSPPQSATLGGHISPRKSWPFQ